MLHLGDVSAATLVSRTPEGHTVHLVASGRIVGLTLSDARRALDRDGELPITLPVVRVPRDDLAPLVTSERDQAWLRELRGAVYRGDGVAVVALASTDLPLDVLQLAGDGSLVALAQSADGAEALARRCVEALGARGWEGDDVLARELVAALDARTTALRSVPVDLDELADALEGDPAQGGGRIDLLTGDVWPEPSLGDLWDEVDADDEERWLSFDSEGSAPGLRTWRTSSRRCATSGWRGASARRSEAAERSVGFATRSPTSRTSSIAGCGSPTSAAVDAHGRGLPIGEYGRSRCLAGRDSGSSRSAEAVIGPRVFARGEAYALAGRVSLVERGADVLTASVEGTETYSVRVRVTDDPSALDRVCSCPVGVRW